MDAHERNNVCPPGWELLLADARELPAADQRRVEEHTAGCTACRQRLRRANALVNAYGVMEEISAASPTMPLLTLMQPTSSPKSRWLGHCSFRRVVQVLVVGAAIVGIVVGVSSLQPRLEAEELLQRVVRAEQTSPGRGDDVVNASFTSPNGVEKAALSNLYTRPFVREGLRAYGWDYRNPLSITPFRKWRDGLPEKSDYVRETIGTIAIRTVTSTGLVREAELVIESRTFQVIAVRLKFGAGLLEVTEIRRGRDAISSATAAARPAPPQALFAPAASPEALSGDSDTAAVPKPNLSKWIARVRGAAPAGQDFIPQTEVLTRNIRQHLDELHRLAMRHPALDIGDATNAESAELARQILEHVAPVRKDLATLDFRLAFLFTDLTVQSYRQRHDVPVDWRERVTDAREHASRLEQLLGELATHDDMVPVDHPAGARAFESTLRALWTAMNEPDRDET